MRNNRTIIIALSTVLVLAIAVVASLTLVNNSKFHMVSSAPANNSTKVSSTDSIIFKFNRELDPESSVGFSIDPYVPGKTTVTGDSLIFTPTTYYEVDGKYTAKLLKAKNKAGEIAPDAVVHFTVSYLPYSDLSKSQRDEAQKRTDQLQNSDTLAAKLPYSTLDYDLAFHLNSKNEIIYDATLNIFNKYPNDAAFTAQYRTDLARFKAEVLAYIRSQGFDPNTLTILWDPAEATSVGEQLKNQPQAQSGTD